MDALRNLLGDGGDPDAAAAARRCFAARVRSAGSAAPRPAAPRGAVVQRSQWRSSGCRGHTACRRRPMPCNWRRRTPGGCPRRREIAIEDWTRVGTVRHTAPSRRRGLPCRVLKEARRVTTPCAGLPSCTGLMVAAPCSERPAGEPAEPGGQRPRRRRQEPEPRAALLGTESEPDQTAGIRRIHTAVDTGFRCLTNAAARTHQTTSQDSRSPASCEVRPNVSHAEPRAARGVA